MDKLNSLIIEGDVSKPLENGSFQIEVKSYSKKDGDVVTSTSYFDVDVFGALMTETVKNNAHVGRGIRVVGRLHQTRWEENDKPCSRISIIAEHIDFKMEKPNA